jgi:hypothetical protein
VPITRLPAAIFLLGLLCVSALAAPPGETDLPSAGSADVAATHDPAPPALLILSETNRTSDDLPIYRVSPHSEEISRKLTRGFAGRMVRLYAAEQRYLQSLDGTDPEPAYLLLSGNEGGFPRFGFCLEDSAAGTLIKKPNAGYVDLHRKSDLSGRFGAVDQIYPHELAHVIIRQLAGDRKAGGSNQVHAIGVCTDRTTAWDEGLAEHCQVMAIDDPGADPATRALAGAPRQRAERTLAEYRRELVARFAFATHRRMGFLLWFSQTEQALRYHAVKANAFARAPVLPASLAARPYNAYLLENILPGSQQGPLKPVARLLSTEGVVSALMVRWVTDDALRNSYSDDNTYRLFGLDRADVSPEDNVYLKLFHVFHTKQPADLAGLVRGYREAYPIDAAEVDRLVYSVLGDSLLLLPPEIWLDNRGFSTGTSLFDQYRAVPRAHTFDLNAASMADLMGVRGMRRPLAEAILNGAPYETLEDLSRVPGMTPAVTQEFARMASDMRALSEGGAEAESNLTVRSLLVPVFRRALVALLLATLCGAVLYHIGSGAGPLRSVLSAFAASLFALLAGWFAGVAGQLPAEGTGIVALGVVVLVFGLPAAIRAAVLARRRLASPLEARPVRALHGPGRALFAWVLAGLPAAILLVPWF